MAEAQAQHMVAPDNVSLVSDQPRSMGEVLAHRVHDIDLASPDDIDLHTVKVKFSSVRFPIGRGDVMDKLDALGIEADEVIGMGPVGEGRMWNIVLASIKARDVVLGVDHVSLNGGQMIFSSGAKTIAKVRVHWLPLKVPDSVVIPNIEKKRNLKAV